MTSPGVNKCINKIILSVTHQVDSDTADQHSVGAPLVLQFFFSTNTMPRALPDPQMGPVKLIYNMPPPLLPYGNSIEYPKLLVLLFKLQTQFVQFSSVFIGR